MNAAFPVFDIPCGLNKMNFPFPFLLLTNLSLFFCRNTIFDVIMFYVQITPKTKLRMLSYQLLQNCMLF